MTTKLVLAAIAFALIKVANASEVDIAVTGNDFELSVLQSSGNNFLEGSVIGNQHRITSEQTSNSSAGVDLTNNGGSVDLIIQQDNSAVNVTKICTNPAGCAISIDQR